MAQLQITLSCGVALPWWWKLYVRIVIIAHDIGVIEPDPDAMTSFVLRHARFFTQDRRGRRRYQKLVSDGVK